MKNNYMQMDLTPSIIDKSKANFSDLLKPVYAITKRFTLISLLIIFLYNHPANGQGRSCATMDYLTWQKSLDPTIEARMIADEAQLQQLIANPDLLKTTTIVTIPVVVHVVYNSAVQNISDVLIQSQIDILNEDYNAMNSDVAKVPPYFKSRIGNSEVKFCLASRDPSGNPTNGIVRVSTSTTSFSTNNNVKHTNLGGHDAWPMASYLNIWVCNLGGSLLGYAQFPNGGSAANDGVVILYDAFGRLSAGAPFNYGRSATHEVGHWLNLFHIWGDDGGTCTGSDQVSDTPNQGSENYGCPCQKVSCSNNPHGEMYQNYMDYSDDACMYMFSAGQTARITATLAGARASLASSLGCTPPSLNAVDAGISEIISPVMTPCTNTTSAFIPEVTLKNYGSDTLTTCTINYKVDNGAVQTYIWTGSLASGVTTNVTLSSVTATAADHLFYCYTTNPNGAADGNVVNDRITGNFIGKSVNTALPLLKDFTSALFPPAYWTNKKYDCSTGWARTTTAFQSSPASIYFNNFAQTATNSGRYYDLYTQTIDLSSATNASMAFWVAYAPKTVSNSDTLEVLISTDCGYTYTSIYKKWGSTLQTAVAQTTAFVPTASQWRQDFINLGAYATVTNAMFIFRNITTAGNNMYLDDIQFDNALAIADNQIQNGFNIYPNPTTGLFNITCDFNSANAVKVSVVNVLGKLISEQSVLPATGNTIALDLSKASKGVYFVRLETKNGTVVKKLIVE
ncbi:MAG: T9SS type A sorting domain-containing protein [Bacteroidia bacterium]